MNFNFCLPLGPSHHHHYYHHHHHHSITPECVTVSQIHWSKMCQCHIMSHRGVKSIRVYEGAVPAGGDNNRNKRWTCHKEHHVLFTPGGQNVTLTQWFCNTLWQDTGCKVLFHSVWAFQTKRENFFTIHFMESEVNPLVLKIHNPLHPQLAITDLRSSQCTSVHQTHHLLKETDAVYRWSP